MLHLIPILLAGGAAKMAHHHASKAMAHAAKTVTRNALNHHTAHAVMNAGSRHIHKTITQYHFPKK